jgi:uncharacterized protein (DUF983 family)
MILPDGNLNPKKRPSLMQAAFLGLCPDCGAKTLFSRVTRFADTCATCGVNFSRYNVGDGPAAFLIMGVGALILAGAILLHLTLAPPFWVHVVLWVPLTIGLTVAGLRVAKAVLLIIEHRKQAHEGQIIL